MTDSGSGDIEQGGGLRGGVRNATFWMGVGTGVSRLTGFARLIVLALALGTVTLSTSFNLANTIPNMLYDLVLGGVLSATFIPVFVDRLSTRGEREAWRAISAVITLAVVVLGLATVVFWFLAPSIIASVTAFDHVQGAPAGATLVVERAAATELLRWFVPQVALYGLFALGTALLNTRRRFVAPMWMPIANNLVCIGVLLWFRHIAGSHLTLPGFMAHRGEVVLLGLGTTLGVALQAALLIPALARVRLNRLRWRWEPAHEAVRTVARLGRWTLGFVLLNQAANFVVLALAVGAPPPAPISAYTYAYAFLQMPYAVVGVSVMTRVTPELAEHWATGAVDRFRRRFVIGLRSLLAVILPAAVGYLLLAIPASDLIFAHGATKVSETGNLSGAVAMFALGLPGFCTYMYVIRAMQAMQRPQTAFWLYLIENSINVLLALALVGPMGVRGLALSYSVAYTVSAVGGLVILRHWLGSLGDRTVWRPTVRVAVASLCMAIPIAVVSNLSTATQGLGVVLRVVGGAAAGGIVFVGVAAMWARRVDGGQAVRRAAPR